ncbi:MAG: peptidylprolyl isomerase [Prolixibacteraceae bacterium]
MKKIISLSFLLLFMVVSVVAQKNIIVSIDDHKYSKDEYEKIYVKNNTQLNDESEIKTPQEYLDLFINYKLKVIAAEKEGLDTLKSFIDELAGYREELAKPYLTDINITDSVLHETYYRTTHMLKCSHILINLPPNASAEDTLKIYNQLLDIRQQFLNHEKSFEELAEAYSQDPSAKFNKGQLGYFKAFNMVTEFENAAYSTKIGEVSLPFHTEYGFHIVYVSDKQELSGEVKVSHIMKMFKNRNNISEEEKLTYKQQMDSIYQLLQGGADFATIAREFSDDKNSSKNGGDMGYLSKTFNVTEFVDVVYQLQNDGDYSQPFETPFGWHIALRTGFKPVPTFEQEKADLIEKVKKDPLRSKHSKELYYKNKKEELNFIAYKNNIEKFKAYINEQFEDTITNEIFPEDILTLPLYQIADEKYTVKIFYDLQKKLKTNKSKFRKPLFFFHLDNYDETVINDYMDKHLESLYPEFAQIMQEYHDGMLLFSIMEKEVWNKAVIDSTGLENYYESNKNKYIWEDHFDGLLIRCNNQEAADSCNKYLEKGITDVDVLEAKLNTDNKRNVKITKGKWEEGTNKRVDYLIFGGEMPERFKPEFELFKGEVVKAGSPKTLDEARGLYISDYQQVLEDNWIQFLRDNSKIKVNKKLLKQIKGL